MNEALCGKSCEAESCALRGELNCPGCLMGPGNEMYGDCAIARCVRTQKVDSCVGCPRKLGCTETAVKDLMPSRRRSAHAAKVAKAAVMDRRGPYMRRLLWALFWLSLVHLLELHTIFDEGHSLYRAARCANDAIGLAMGMILVALAQEERPYLVPGCIMAGVAVHDYLLHMLTVGGAEPGWSLLTALVMPYVQIALVYFLLTAHAGTAPDVDPVLGEKWINLRKWYMVCLGGITVCSYLLMILPLVVTVITGVLAIVYIVLEIIQLVYLYRMAKGYSRLCGKK